VPALATVGLYYLAHIAIQLLYQAKRNGRMRAQFADFRD